MKAKGTIVHTTARTSTSPFRPGTSYDVIYNIGKRKPGLRKETLVRKAAKATRKSLKKVRFDVDVLMNPKHRSNGNRVKANTKLKKTGKVLLERV